MSTVDEKIYKDLRDRELLGETISVVKVTGSGMALPLFFLFWIVDLITYPEFKWTFLAIRALIVPLFYVTSKLSVRATSSLKIQRIACVYSIAMAGGINIMLYLINFPGSSYYGGLNLVATGCLSFIPFSRRYFVYTALGIYVPYYLVGISQLIQQPDHWPLLLANSFFIFSSVAICFLIRKFNESLRIKEITSRLQLHNELENRESIIRIQTDEAVRLKNLSTQFSPQIVDSIRSGKLKLESTGQRAEICAVFIDIVNSTDKVTSIDKDKVDLVLTKFLEDSIRILLKYDITIDKFLGDGILAFCNAPLKRMDYASRVVKAALEIREKITMDCQFYELHWNGPLTLRMGIARGYVNVGFYGSKKYYQSYTAIGPAVNLASRLCSSAEPGEILMEKDVYEMVSNEFDTEALGKRSLKGFEREAFHVYKIISSKDRTEKTAANMSECSTCGGILSLETNDQGQFVFMCRTCCTIVDMKSYEENLKSGKKAA